MKSCDFHVFTKVFLVVVTIFAMAAAFSGPDNILIHILVLIIILDLIHILDLDHHFMAQDPGKYKIPVALFPHFGIGSAYGAAHDVCQDFTL